MDPDSNATRHPSPTLTQQLLGVVLVALCCVAQWTYFMQQWPLAQYSPLGIMLVPMVLIPGWLINGLLLGGLVINRSKGTKRFIIGFIIASFLTFCVVAAGLTHLNKI